MDFLSTAKKDESVLLGVIYAEALEPMSSIKSHDAPVPTIMYERRSFYLLISPFFPVP